MRLYIIRHADPDYANHTITAAGHKEAKALARRLAGYELTHIYSSPLNRAQETARYTADLTGIEPVIEDWLQEPSEWRIDILDRAGTPQNYVAWDLHGEMVRGDAALPTHETWHEHPALPAPQSREEFERIKASSDAFSARHGYVRAAHRYQIEHANQHQIAVFCHNGLALCWLAHLLEIPLTLMWAGFWLAPSSVTTVVFDERSDQWAVPRCLSLGDTSHLYADRLPVRPRGIRGNFL
jgi:broad specificity phosphatase PhoE